ncbi:MAG: hypothetical protein M2R45_03272 [Verrucomicrobia subdivision 3 bacterium]|nr:hypothetical protein [Limisphaerales bacterium]MCS1416132.1 hypothetical protein [Limisphaerales bacterium]
MTARILPRLNGLTDNASINTLTNVPLDILTPDFLTALENHLLRIALQENNVSDWRPKAALRMYHCSGDETVLIEIFQKALNAFFHANANTSELIDPIPILNHKKCAVISFTSAMAR